MNDNMIHFKSFGIQRLLLPVLGVKLPQDDGDLVQLGPVNAMGGRGDVPVVEQNSATLITADPDMSLPRKF